MSKRIRSTKTLTEKWAKSSQSALINTWKMFNLSSTLKKF